MVTDYRGTKGRRALGPLFLEETRRSFSLPRRHPSPRLLRVPYSELLITFACISPLFLPHALARSSRCSLLLRLRLFLALSFCLLLPSPFLSFSLSLSSFLSLTLCLSFFLLLSFCVSDPKMIFAHSDREDAGKKAKPVER